MRLSESEIEQIENVIFDDADDFDDESDFGFDESDDEFSDFGTSDDDDD